MGGWRPDNEQRPTAVLMDSAESTWANNRSQDVAFMSHRVAAGEIVKVETQQRITLSANRGTALRMAPRVSGSCCG